MFHHKCRNIVWQQRKCRGKRKRRVDRTEFRPHRQQRVEHLLLKSSHSPKHRCFVRLYSLGFEELFSGQVCSRGVRKIKQKVQKHHRGFCTFFILEFGVQLVDCTHSKSRNPERIPKASRRNVKQEELRFLSRTRFYIKGKNCKKSRILKNIGKKEVRKFAG